MLALLAATCAVLGSGAFTAPDNRCTPGAYRPLSRAQVCRHNERPSLPSAAPRRILTEYGVPPWSGRAGELDHHKPFFVGALTTEDNIWRERGRIPNRKDRLED